MAPERLSKFLARKVFRPFVIHVGDGRAIHVQHPEMGVLLKGGRTLLLSLPDGSSHLIDVFLITGVETQSSNDWDFATEFAF